MTTPSENLVEDAIKNQRPNGKEITGTDLGKKVEQEVAEKTKKLRDQFGDAVHELVGDAEQEVQGYKKTLDDLVGNHLIGDTASEGAAGYNDKGDGNKVVISEEASELHVEDPEYWKRVRIHEEQHQNEQTFSVNQQELRYIDATGSVQTATVVGDLTERDAIRASEQPDTDLVPEYVEHAKIGDEVADIVGEQELRQALQSGDILSLQQHLIDIQREQILAQLGHPQSAQVNSATPVAA